MLIHIFKKNIYFFKKGIAFYVKLDIIDYAMTFRDSSMVEHSAVNR